jgi:hypothetical protein
MVCPSQGREDVAFTKRISASDEEEVIHKVITYDLN